MKKIFLPLLALVALASCTQNDMDLKGSDEQVEIKLKSTALSIDASSTRAPFEGVIAADNILEAKVLLSSVTSPSTHGVYNSTNTDLVNGEIIFKDDKANPSLYGFETTPQYYPVDPDAEVALVGLYPKNATFVPSEVIPAASSGVYDVTVLGNEDLMVAPEVITKKSQVVTTTPVYPMLDFVHLLTRLDIKVVAKDAESEKAWGKIKQITLTKVGNAAIKNILSVNLTPNVTPIAQITGTVPTFPFYVVDWVTNPDVPADPATAKYTDTALSGVAIEIPVAADPDAPATDAKEVAYTMVAPFDATTSATVDLNVITEESKASGYPLTARLTLDTSIAANPDAAAMRGKKIVITLTFVGTEIQAKANVADWVEGGDANEEIQ